MNMNIDEFSGDGNREIGSYIQHYYTDAQNVCEGDAGYWYCVQLCAVKVCCVLIFAWHGLGTRI